MAKIKLKSKETNFIKLPSNFKVEHQTDRGILLSNTLTEEGEWFPLSYVKISGNEIEVADWLVSKSDLLSDLTAGTGTDKDSDAVPF